MYRYYILYMLALSFVLMALTPGTCVEFYDVNTPSEGLAEWKELTLQNPMRFFSGYTQHLYIHRNGFISNTTVAPAIVRIPSDKTVISAYNLQYSSFTTWHVDQGNLNHIEKAKDDVRKYTNDAFTPTTVVIATYNSFLRYSGNNNTFQIVLASDNTKTYGILLYKRLDEGGAIVGYNDGHCNVKMLTSTVFSQQLAQTSNVGERGKHTIDLNTDTVCHYSDIYPHTSAKKELVEDTRISYIWPLQKGFKIFGANYSTFYLTPGGLITIDKPISELERSRFDIEKHNGGLMCPYWADLSTKTSGKIFYEETNDNSLLQTASSDVSSFDKRYERFIATNMAIVTFDNVPEAGDITRNNSFQTVVVGGISDTFMIVKYTKLDSLSLGNIYRDKDGICIRDTFSTYKDSVGLVNQSNTGITGKFIFRLTSVSCSQSDLFINLFYQVGVNAQSAQMLSSSQLFQVRPSFPLPVMYTLDMYVYRNGMISGIMQTHDVVTKVGNFKSSDVTTSLVAAYNLNYDASSNYVITASESSEPNLLHEINKDVTRAGDNTFNGTRVFVITYENMETRGIPFSKSNFQLVMIEDGKTTYVIFNYKRLDGIDAFVGFASPICRDYDENDLIYEGDSRDLETATNVGIPGRFVLKLFDKCYTSPMYDYGVSNGDTLVPAESGAIKIDLPKVMPLFSKSLQYIYANNFGLIGDQETLRELQISLPNKENIIAIYNLRGRSEFYYRVTHQPFILSKASKDVHKFASSNEFVATQAVIVSFVNFGDKDGVGLNTAQVVIVTDDVTTYAIFNYERLDMMKGTTGFTNAGCSWDSIRENQKVHELALQKNLSNVDILGRNVRLLTPKECKPTSIYAYGEQFGDRVSQLSSTNSPYDEFNTLLPVFGSRPSSFYITRHGAITFGSSYNGSDLQEFENHPTLALFMGSNSLDPGYGGEIYSYIGADAGFIRVVLDDIKDYVELSFKPKIIIVITFSKVGNEHNKRTTSLQAIFLTDQQTTTYVVVQYLTLGVSGAFMGMIDPNCEHRMKQYQSDHDVLNNGDTGQKGKYIFQLKCREMNLSTATSPPVDNSVTTKSVNKASTLLSITTPPSMTTSEKESKALATPEKSIIIGGSAAGAAIILVVVFVCAMVIRSRKEPTHDNDKSKQ